VFEDSEWKVLEVEGFRFFWPRHYSDSALPGLYRQAFAPAVCNPHAYEVGAVCIRSGDWVVDAGACEGFFTQYALQRGAQVLMIEPVPKLAQALSYTFEQEMRAGRVRLLQGGIGESAGEMRLKVPQDAVYDAHISQEGTEPVTMYPLDGLIGNGIVPAIDFVKMDIEGYEIAAFKGAHELLRSHSPRLAIAVYHEFPNAQIVRSLILEAQPAYQVSWRGVFFPEGLSGPRPFMLHARV
jgi:FkbM family methyltransferase